MAMFESVIDILKINLHVELGENYDTSMVERFNSFLNKCILIFSNENDTTRSFVEAALIISYA